MSGAFLTGLLIGLAVGLPLVAGLLAWAYARRRRCPACGRPLPVFRRPASPREAIQGGWTCAGCGTRIDRAGRSLPAS